MVLVVVGGGGGVGHDMDMAAVVVGVERGIYQRYEGLLSKTMWQWFWKRMGSNASKLDPRISSDRTSSTGPPRVPMYGTEAPSPRAQKKQNI